MQNKKNPVTPAKLGLQVSPKWADMCFKNLRDIDEFGEFTATCWGICTEGWEVEGFTNPKLQALFEKTVIVKADMEKGTPGFIGLKQHGHKMK